MLRMLLGGMMKRARKLVWHMPDDKLAGIRAAFAVRYREVLNACMTLQNMIDMTPRQLTGRYMSSVMREQEDEGWWLENSVYLAEAWFIYEYACAQGIVKQAKRCAINQPEQMVIMPERTEHEGYVRICIERRAGNLVCGRVLVEYDQADEAFCERVKANGYRNEPRGYTRLIGETDGPICDRAVETAVALLRQGYRVCVREPLLQQKILAEDYEAERRYWVIEGSTVDKLELRYPKDQQLHQYVYKLGGRWNGKAMEISICSAHMLDDLIRLYGFCVTEGAKARMDAWREAVEQATIYRPRRRKGVPDEPTMIDRFKQLMDKKPQIIDDLYENDE